MQEDYRILRCPVCKLVQFSPLPEEAVVHEFYTNQYDAAGERASYFQKCRAGYEGSVEAQQLDQKLEWIRRVLPSGKDLLDVGCGTGVFLDLARKKGWRVRGIEISKRASAYARETFNLGVYTGSVDSWDGGEGKSFDLITMLDVLEHLRDPATVLRRVKKLLKENGLLVIEVPNQDSLLNRVVHVVYKCGWKKPAHVIYNIHHLFNFNTTSIKRLFSEAGFSIVRIDQDSTYLGRIKFKSSILRLGTLILLNAGKLLRMENKLVVMAKIKRGEDI